MSYILVTGGVGFIGSHICVELQDYKVLVIDNLSNSCESRISQLPNITFKNVDITNKIALTSLFQQFPISCVIHLAGLKSVSDSITDPLNYYTNNVVGATNLLQTMQEFKCHNIIFSSSATVYGDQESPLFEDLPTGQGITNPYGRTKYFIEEMLKDVYNSQPDSWKIVILRYFNPIASLPHLPENPKTMGTNLFPHLLKHAKNYTVLQIFGKDHPTIDGSPVRDFISVIDLAKAHVAAMTKFQSSPNIHIYNVGTGQGVSVLELVNEFSKIKDVKYEFVGRRQGDLSIAYANVDKINRELGWKAKKTISDMCADGYRSYSNP